MPNSVQAAAEGMPNTNRRTALALTATGIVAALGGMATGTTKALANWQTLAAVIDAHKSARAAFNGALDREQETETDYFATHGEEVLIPISIGGAQTFRVRFDLDEAADGCRVDICRTYESALKRLDSLKLSPELHKPAEQSIKGKLRADLALLRRAHKA